MKRFEKKLLLLNTATRGANRSSKGSRELALEIIEEAKARYFYR